MYWSVIETNVGILAASIPSYKPLVKRYAPRLLGSYAVRDDNKHSGFKMMGYGKSTGSKKDQSALEVQSGNAPDTLRKGQSTFVTHTKTGIQDNSSEEELFAPIGRIGVKTEIVQEFDRAGPSREPSPLSSRTPGN
jgi:hypothetical protein